MESEHPADETVAAARLRVALDRPVVLVGMMGVGKSSLGRRLAATLGAPFADADEEIERAAQMTIPEMFAAYGEPYFRAGERRVIARLLGADQAPGLRVIATGGGAFVDPATRALILAQGLAVWLDAEVEVIHDRVARRGTRPLLDGADPRATIDRLRTERAPLYAHAPIHVHSNPGPHARTLALILEAIANWLSENPRCT